MTSDEDDYDCDYQYTDQNEIFQHDCGHIDNDYESNILKMFGNFTQNNQEQQELNKWQQIKIHDKKVRFNQQINYFYIQSQQYEYDEQENDDHDCDQLLQDQNQQNSDDEDIEMDLGDDIDEFQINDIDENDYDNNKRRQEDLDINEEDQQMSSDQISQIDDEFDQEFQEYINEQNHQMIQIPTISQQMQDLQQNVRFNENNQIYIYENEEDHRETNYEGYDSFYDSENQDDSLDNYFGNVYQQQEESKISDEKLLSIINSYPSQIYNSNVYNVETVTCAVCIDDLKSGCMFKMLKCSHQFHSNCIDDWLKVKLQCPLCKQTVDKI